VTRGEPGRIVVAQPDLHVGILPGQRLHGQIQGGALTAMHQTRAHPRVAEDEQLRGTQLQTRLDGTGGVVDPVEDV
jgi:hypothetical protein